MSKFPFNRQVAHNQSGYNPELDDVFRAAAFLASFKPKSASDRPRRAVVEFGEDVKSAALQAYGLEISEANVKALEGVLSLLKSPLEQVQKSEGDSVTPLTLDAQETAEEVQRAFLSGDVEWVELKGKHSKGTQVCKDPTTEHTYLLKPGSGNPSPAAGVSEESASQSKRECAFWKVTDELEISDNFPRADLLSIGGHEVACMRLLPPEFHSLDYYFKSNPNFPHQMLEKYRKNGTLHKWAIVDFILGQVDRHSNNILASEKGDVYLIDNGSAFAGPSFDPANDPNTFIPFYLRSQIRTQRFNAMDAEEKLYYMPRVPDDVNRQLLSWIDHISPQRLELILNEYGINPQPVLERLSKIKEKVTQEPVDLTINKFWVTT